MSRELRVVVGAVLSAVLAACRVASPLGPPALQRSAAYEVADSWIASHPAHTLRWDWRDGVLVYGMWRFYLFSRAPKYRDYVRAYMRHHLQRGVRVRWSDHATPGLTAAELVLDGERAFRPLVDQVVAYAMSAPRTEATGLIRHTGGRIPRWFFPGLLPDAWVDSLFHLVPLLQRHTQITKQPRFEDEALSQLSAFSRHLQDARTGLFTHAYNDAPRDAQVPGFEAGAFWARGNGWALATFAEVLARMDARDPRASALEARLRRLSAALQRVQRADGLFHTVLLDKASYAETAGSALIGYGWARAVRAGRLDESALRSARRVMIGLTRMLERDGRHLRVTGTSLGTNPIAWRYRRIGQRADVSYGVGAWLLAASELWSEETLGSAL